MKARELRQKTVKDLKKMAADKKDELRAMRFKVAQRQLKKVHDIKKTKRLIARLLTIINQKQRQENSVKSEDSK